MCFVGDEEDDATKQIEIWCTTGIYAAATVEQLKTFGASLDPLLTKMTTWSY
jgi:hypothetical protein